MAGVKRKEFRLPPLDIDKEFLIRLGEILEKEKDERIVDHQNKKKETKGYISPPHISIWYTLKSEDSILTFNCMNDLLETDTFPEDINSLNIRIIHYGTDDYVNVNLTLAQKERRKYFLESSNENKLLDIKNRLDKLFKENEPVYSPINIPLKITLSIVIFLLILRLFYVIIPFLFGEGIKNTVKIVFLILFPTMFGPPTVFLIYKFLDFMFPYTNIQLNKRSIKKIDTCKKIFYVLTSGIVVGVILSLII